MSVPQPDSVAKAVFAASRASASRKFGSSFLWPEFVLFHLLEATDGIIVAVFDRLHVDRSPILIALDKLTGPDAKTSDGLGEPLSIASMEEAARELGSSQVGVEHVLLCIAWGEGPGRDLLVNRFHVDPVALKAIIRDLVAQPA